MVRVARRARIECEHRVYTVHDGKLVGFKPDEVIVLNNGVARVWGLYGSFRVSALVPASFECVKRLRIEGEFDVLERAERELRELADGV